MASSLPHTLPSEALASFVRDGYLVLPHFFTKVECRALIDQAATLIAAFDPSTSATTFSTEDEVESRDAYFLGSGDKIRFFWETKAKVINKIGHALHALDPVYRTFSTAPKLASLCQALGQANPTIVQSMHIFKSAEVGGKVDWHQDETYLSASPGGVLGLWVALEDATEANGCLWALPGAHRSGLKKRFVRDGMKTTTEELDPVPWDTSAKVPLPVPQGSIIVLHGLLPHMSEPNTSPASRHAYTLHLMDHGATFSPSNWLRPAPLRLQNELI